MADIDPQLVEECQRGKRPLIELVHAIARERDVSWAMVLYGKDTHPVRSRTALKSAEHAALYG